MEEIREIDRMLFEKEYKEEERRLKFPPEARIRHAPRKVQEVKEIEITCREDTLDINNPVDRPWPVTPPPDPEWVLDNVYIPKKAKGFSR